MSKNTHVLLALLLSLSPGAAPANVCERTVARALDIVPRIASRAVHYAGVSLRSDRAVTKQRIFQHLRRLGAPRGVRVFREDADGLTAADYDKGLANLAAALGGMERMALAGELRDIVITRGEGVFIREGLLTDHIHARIPFDAPTESLAQRLSAALLENAIKKKFSEGGLVYLIKDSGLSHESYVEALERLHATLESDPAPDELRNISGITVTDESVNMQTRLATWSDEDAVPTLAYVAVPADALHKLDRIATTLLESRIREMLGAFDHLDWRRFRPDIPEAASNEGVDEVDYRNALRRIIPDLRAFMERRREGGLEAGTGRPLGRLARIVVAPGDGPAKLAPAPHDGRLTGHLFDPFDLVELRVPVERLSREGLDAPAVSRLLEPPGKAAGRPSVP